jgi:hypothetical protein
MRFHQVVLLKIKQMKMLSKYCAFSHKQIQTTLMRNLSDPGDPLKSKINAYFLQHFDLTSYDEKEVREFRWYDVDFDAEVKLVFCAYATAGRYYGAWRF